jgi:23S rRNA (uracil1939-C5)-methyltransferase
VVDAFAHRGIAIEPPPLVRIGHGSRRRAVLGAACKGGRLLLGFREEGQHRLVDLEQCVVLDPLIVAALPSLRALAGVLVGEGKSARVTVTRLDAGLDVDVEAGVKVIAPDTAGKLAAIAEAARLVRLTVDRDTLAMRASPVLTVGGAAVEVPPGVFVQAVAAAETALTSLVLAPLGKVKRIADLFCGIGTFTFPLARRAEVLAVDGDKRAVAALAHAAKRAQGTRRIEAKTRDLFREPLSRKELEGFDAVVFDPPRAGAEAQAAMIAKSAVPLAIAVSCNPATLARDARVLLEAGFALESVTAVDQFLYAAHIEAVAVFRRPRRQ